MIPSSSHSVAFTLAAIAWAALPASAPAVGFVLQNASSYFPAGDPDGSRLTEVMEAAAVRYNRILRDNWSIGLSYRYEPPGATASVAGSSIHGSTVVTLADGSTAQRALSASVVFNGGTSWWFDPTPLDDDEFAFSPETYAELSTERKAVGFVGDVPPRLETSYEGVARTDVQGIDALSVALHELGHVLGVVATFAEAAADGDYDLPPKVVHGAEVAVMTLAGDPNHLQVRGSLMDPAISARTRTLPSAADVFAMAAASGWQQIDLPRKEFWGGPGEGPGEVPAEATWLDPFNWSGNRLPDVGDDVFLRSGGTARIGGAAGGQAEAGRLFVDGQTTLAVDGGRLAAGELHLVEGARLVVHRDGSATGERLVAASASAVELELGPPPHAPLVFLEGTQLAGGLQLALSPGYTPAPGDSQTLLVTRQLSGTLDRVILSPANALEGLDVLLDVTTAGSPAEPLETLVARFVLRGDVNADGVVDQADLDTVLLDWGKAALPAHVAGGDLDGNARVDQADLDRVLLNWGAAADQPGRSILGVPEPAGLPIALSLIFAALLFRGSGQACRRDLD